MQSISPALWWRPVLWRIGRVLSWALLALGLLLALGWGALHAWIVPRIGEYREALQTVASRAVGLPVRIGEVRAFSTGWVPSIELRETVLLDAQGREALRLPRVLVAISVRSVLRLGLEQLVIDAPELDIRRSTDGRWSVAGLPLSAGAGQDSPAADWLFAQREVLVRNGVLRWYDEQRSARGSAVEVPPLSLRQVDLIVRNEVRQHALRLDATPPAEWGERFVLSGRFRRGLLSQHPGRWRDWSGQLYAYWPQAELQPWRPYWPVQADVQAGQGRVRLWSDFQRGAWVGGVVDVDLQDLRAVLREDLPPLQLQQLAGRLTAERQGEGWRLASRGLNFRSRSGLQWPGGDLTLHYTEARGTQPASGRLQGERLDLQAVHELALRLPLSAPLHDSLQAWQVQGELSQLSLRWQGRWPQLARYALQLQGQDLQFEPRRAAPSATTPAVSAPVAGLGLRGARLQLSLDEQQGQAQLSMPRGGSLWLGGVLEEPLVPVRSLQAELQWQRGPDGRWRVDQASARLDNADLSGQVQGRWSPTASGPGHLELDGRFARADATRIHRYLPLGVGEVARHYVRDAILKGQASDVRVKVRGDLARLPFADPADGEFRFAGQVRDLQMAYVPERLLPPGSRPWPALQSVRGDLVFDRLSMHLSGASGVIGEGLQFSNLRADIADMAHQPVVEVQADVRGPAQPALRLVRQSPLGQMLAGTLDQAQVSGTLSHRLRLSIPVLQSAQTRVQGSVQLQDNDVQLMPQVPLIERARGQVHYTEKGFELKGVQGFALGGPVQLQGGWRVDSPAQDASSLAIRAEGVATAQGLQQSAQLQALAPLWRQVQGQTAYTAQVGWRSGLPELDIRSQLQGLALQLPAPLGKTAATSVSFQVSSQVLANGQRDRLSVTLQDRASAVYIRDLAREGDGLPRVRQGTLTLGTGPASAPPLPASGVSALLVMDRLSLDDWRALQPDTAAAWGPDADAAQTALLGYLPNRMGLQAGEVVMEGRTLHGVSAGIQREDRRWRISVDARELSGQAEYEQADARGASRLKARLARLDLPESAEQDVTRLLETAPQDLPTLDLVVEAFQLRGKSLGRIEVEAANVETAGPRLALGREWRLNRLNLRVPEAELSSSGRWSPSAGVGAGAVRRTELDFRLDLRDAGALLARLGMPDVLRAGSGRLQGRVGWAGTPLALHYPSLNGQLHLDLARGQFLKADAGAAKLLGVLSLQALPRRLLLDFRDVFAEGFAFDAAQGDVSIREGMASTRNLQIRGVNAVVQMQGSADLARETQDLQVLILPEVDTGTASLVAGLTVNPVVGLTTYLAQLFLRQPLRQANTQAFRIDGSWRDPRITRMPLNRLTGPGPAASEPALPASQERP